MILLADTNACVKHFKPDCSFCSNKALFAAKRERSFAYVDDDESIGSELGAVAQEVDQDLLQPLVVGINLGRQVRAQSEKEVSVLFEAHLYIDQPVDLLNHVTELHFLKVDGEFSALELRVV